MDDHTELKSPYELVVGELNAAREETITAYAVLKRIMDAKTQGRTYEKRAPVTTVKLVLDGHVSAEFKGTYRWLRNTERFEFDGIDLRITMASMKRPVGVVHLDTDGKVRPTAYGFKTGRHFGALTAHLLRLIAKGEAHLLALSEGTRCRICSKGLTDPVSIESGIGPECIKYLFSSMGDWKSPEQQQADVEALLARVREIRLQMKEAHPDLGGSGDGSLLASFSQQLKKLHEQIDSIKAGTH
jgi:hypothetical protein